MEITKKKRRSNARLPHWPSGRGYAESVAGTSHHLESIEGLCDWGDAESDLFGYAVLTPEPGNAYDQDAVKVVFEERHIGYLCRESAKKYKVKIVENPEVCDPPQTTVYARLSRRLLAKGDLAGTAVFSVGLDMCFDASPNDSGKFRAPLSSPNLLPRLKDFWYIEENRLVILALDLDGRALDLCVPGSGFDIWQKPDSDEVFVYAQGSIGGSGLVMRTNIQSLRRAGFSSIEQFEPRIHLAGGGMVVASAKIPAAGGG